MRSTKALVVLALITLAVVVTALISRQAPRSHAPEHSLLLPDLLGVINDVVTIRGTGGAGSFTLERDESSWRINEKSNYPAAPSKVRQFLIGMTRLQRLEAKTQNPELHGKLGVTDEGDGETESIRVRLDTATANTVAEVIMGKRAPSKADPARTELYVRLPNDPQVWLVEGVLPDYRTPKDWLDEEIFKIDPQRIRQVQVVHSDGETVTVRRRDRSATDYELVERPPQAEIGAAYDLNSIATSLANLRLEDVKPANEIAEETGDLAAELTTFDGLRLTLQTFKLDDASYIRLKASFDPAVIEPAEEVSDSEEQTGKPSPTDDQGGEGRELESPESVEEEVVRVNSRVADWVYQLPDWRLESLAKRTSDLLKQPEKDEKDQDKG